MFLYIREEVSSQSCLAACTRNVYCDCPDQRLVLLSSDLNYGSWIYNNSIPRIHHTLLSDIILLWNRVQGLTAVIKIRGRVARRLTSIMVVDSKRVVVFENFYCILLCQSYTGCLLRGSRSGVNCLSSDLDDGSRTHWKFTVMSL